MIVPSPRAAPRIDGPRTSELELQPSAGFPSESDILPIYLQPNGMSAEKKKMLVWRSGDMMPRHGLLAIRPVVTFLLRARYLCCVLAAGKIKENGYYRP